MEKVKLFVWVDKEVYDRFKEYVFKKYGKLHRVFGLELTKAMKLYLEKEALSKR